MTTHYYAKTQGSKSTKLWTVVGVDDNNISTTIEKDLSMKQALSVVWYMTRNMGNAYAIDKALE